MTNPQVFIDVSINGSPAGRITIELLPQYAPKTAANFLLLCTNRPPFPSYLNTPFHRLVPTLLVQGGDNVRGDGTGGMSALQPGYGPIPDEDVAWRNIDEAGLVCMANRGPNTTTSQFFITLDEAEWLTGRCIVVGKVVQGMEAVVRRVERLELGEGDRPKAKVVIADCGAVDAGLMTDAGRESRQRPLGTGASGKRRK